MLEDVLQIDDTIMLTRWSQIIAPAVVVHQLCPGGVASRSVEDVPNYSAGSLAPRSMLGNGIDVARSSQGLHSPEAWTCLCF